MTFTQLVSVSYDAENPVVVRTFQQMHNPCVQRHSPQRPTGATCVTRASSAKWNRHQISPEVLEKLVLFRVHNRLYFCQTSGLQLEQQ
ncbi:Hypothetical predicted protein [Scomber scombrus]|uniref:Uncharacterized protein n=1 Tax=Scomber scombrus TaxID=13677 RepID=A0AAV1PYQ1_SCOSC